MQSIGILGWEKPKWKFCNFIQQKTTSIQARMKERKTFTVQLESSTRPRCGRTEASLTIKQDLHLKKTPTMKAPNGAFPVGCLRLNASSFGLERCGQLSTCHCGSISSTELYRGVSKGKKGYSEVPRAGVQVPGKATLKPVQAALLWWPS